MNTLSIASPTPHTLVRSMCSLHGCIRGAILGKGDLHAIRELDPLATRLVAIGQTGDCVCALSRLGIERARDNNEGKDEATGQHGHETAIAGNRVFRLKGVAVVHFLFSPFVLLSMV